MSHPEVEVGEVVVVEVDLEVAVMVVVEVMDVEEDLEVMEVVVVVQALEVLPTTEKTTLRKMTIYCKREKQM